MGSGEASSQLYTRIFSWCPREVEGVREHYGVHFTKALMPSWGSILMTSSPPKAPPSNMSPCWLGFQHMNFWGTLTDHQVFPGGASGKEPACQYRRHKRCGFDPWVQSLGWEDPLEEEMATHFSILAWRIPWCEKPGRLQSIGSQRVGRD